MSDERKIAAARAMVAAWNAQDWDEIVRLFAPDGVLHSVMQEPLRGREAIAERLGLLSEGLVSLELEIRALGVIDGRVFLERRDVFVNGHGKTEVPVVGVLSYDADGLVTEWLEYYDRATLLAGFGRTAATDFDGGTE
ncbi:nuclear transport factor 2 family protein [Actinocorallia sp. A-T 12471]|uniref:nuclear transport factor 2 family protein n=1 Tax=Actinocorallia sp. A-T 12471 TaxID=3089813 RepID=UPI0029CB244B|nr:nuclear transport factor 2 family protein [Actinocorallia sp. A-T 12471]MDX6741173.1 nuclear transport factor 2 family protein [Actinocorallia sp. A-T 12471]